MEVQTLNSLVFVPECLKIHQVKYVILLFQLIQLESVCHVNVDIFRRLLIYNGLLQLTVKIKHHWKVLIL